MPMQRSQCAPASAITHAVVVYSTTSCRNTLNAVEFEFIDSKVSQARAMQARGGASDFDVGEYMKSLNVPTLTCGSTAEEVLTTRWCMPSMSITDVVSAGGREQRTRFGPTRFSVVPKHAQVCNYPLLCQTSVTRSDFLL